MLPATIITFLKEHHVLTLCTINADGLPWANNAFYAFNKHTASFYILSAHETRHGQAMLTNPCVCGTVCNTPQGFQEIKGIQFTATATQLQGGCAQLAYCRFYRAFPFAQTISATPIWSIDMQYIKMTDNSSGFGHKETWNRKKE